MRLVIKWPCYFSHNLPCGLLSFTRMRKVCTISPQMEQKLCHAREANYVSVTKIALRKNSSFASDAHTRIVCEIERWLFIKHRRTLTFLFSLSASQSAWVIFHPCERRQWRKGKRILSAAILQTRASIQGSIAPNTAERASAQVVTPKRRLSLFARRITFGK